jgi:hypothetical protein
VHQHQTATDTIETSVSPLVSVNGVFGEFPKKLVKSDQQSLPASPGFSALYGGAKMHQRAVVDGRMPPSNNCSAGNAHGFKPRKWTSHLQGRASSTICILVSSLAIAGCAAVQSQVVGDKTPNGVPYFLPRRPFVITVSMPTGGGLPSFVVGPGTAEPDLSKQFALTQGTNLLAQNEFNITVGSNGLLMTSQSTATSQVAATVANAAATLGMLATPLSAVGGRSVELRGAALAGAPDSTRSAERNIACPDAGTSYQYFVYPELNVAPPLTFTCADGGAYIVTWERVGNPSSASPPPERHYHYKQDNDKEGTSGPVSGLFFRHELPYLVSIRGKTKTSLATESQFIVSSPDESETAYFPVKRSFFANNTANIQITDGVITGVDQTTQSELAGLVGLPATFIGSYMTAVGQLFSGLTSISGGQQKLLQQQQATAVTQTQAAAVAAAQYQACRKTVASFNFTNMSAAQANAAYTAIQAACGTVSN